ncbi:MAG TPA: ABC transporter ATP-binding protein [Saprospiraceae bacterium]|jgi:ABC-2 type transport system ATP-binding protein|nr:ABC transporter ATP-binding protein [Saprospiraceae bacterium]MBK7698230.1 ABC transporter ATP-binding protein [Saprospiraceae bacterium]MBK8827410.1 ABC transporter ATP-binding protein [Saprospiraceae bacterium]MBK8885375.1 ABC transporter ATP-binding protein [Saprospiraceae bacterium]MBK9583267.1 ABC transporter ATP-binding protein [Saprospiraceae bacterium]
MTVLQISGLTKKYGKITALKSLDLKIEQGNVYGLLGPNGSGKTTTLGIILGILKQDDGSFSWFGDKYGDQYRLKIGAILETPNFYPYLNADENLEIIRHIKNDQNADFTELLTMVNLVDRRKSNFSTYSLGMKQRLAIAATLIGEPEVLIFDEPTNGLDPQGIAEVREILKKIANTGKTVIMASHILDEVEKICSHVAIIKKGQLLATGPVGSIINSDITVELASNDMHLLKSFLAGIPMVKSLHMLDKFIEITVDQNEDFAVLNKLAFDNGIILTHFVGRKKRLETEFLEITSKSN